MMFLYPLLSLWWLGFHKSKNQKMVDFQRELEEGWLEEVTLFPNQQLGLNFDDYLGEVPSKLHNGISGSEPSSIWNEWMDEKFDLSIFDCQNDWADSHDDSEKISEEDASAILESLMDSNFSADEVIPFVNEIEATKYLENSGNINSSNSIIEISSPSPVAIVPEILLESPNTPSEEIPQSPVSSPLSACSSYFVASVSEILLESPNTPSEEIPQSPVSSPLSACSSYFVASPECLNADLVGDTLSLPPLISEDSENASDHEGLGQGPSKSSLKISVRARLHPYSATRYKKVESRKERKKVQNKEAAARYREKKRLQDEGLCSEVSELEAKGKELRKKHDELKNEISYLKSLMREMLKKQGLLK